MKPSAAFPTACLFVALCAAGADAQAPVASHAGTAAQPAAVAQSKPAAPAAGRPKYSTVATVNGVALLEDRLMAAMNEVMPYGAYHAGAKPERIAEIRKQALDKLIDEELQYQEAKRLKLIAPAAKVDAEYAKVVKRYKTRQEFLDACRRAGVTTASVREEVRRRVLAGVAADAAVASRCTVSAAEAREYFDRNPSRFEMPEQLHLLTITIGVDRTSTKEQWAAGRKTAESVIARLRAGEDFAALARQHSSDPNKASGGDMGLVHRGRMAEEFEAAVAGAKAGALLGPVQTIYGFHIIKVAEIRPPVQRTFADVRDRLIKDLGEKACTNARIAWMAALRASAAIDIPRPPARSTPPAPGKPPGR